MARPLVMGVLNVTPDSFSDGRRYLEAEAAIEQGMVLVTEGADIVDVGGESTRPGAAPVSVAEELRRVVPVVQALAPLVRVSIDTRHAAVAEAAIAAGATLVNDVSASLGQVAAHAGVGFVAMHMQGDPRSMQAQPTYGDVVSEVGDFLVQRADAAVAAGCDEVWVDPGIGFGKTAAHNLTLLRHLDVLVGRGYPVLVGTSRKRFLGDILAGSDARAPAAIGARAPRALQPDGASPSSPGGDGWGPQPHGNSVPAAVGPVDAQDRVEGSLATAVWAMVQGARMVRAHDVTATVQAAMVVAG
ncbi:MAG: dihydropteroate synthase [Acidimicrobiia bacterium]